MKPDLRVTMKVDAVENDDKLKYEGGGHMHLRRAFHHRLGEISKSHLEGYEILEETLPQPFNCAEQHMHQDTIKCSLSSSPEALTGVHTDFSWELCTSRIEFYHDSGSMIKYHKNLTAKGYRALIYRAPVRDGIVPTWPELMDSESVPCINDEVATEWLNNETVRKAIHAETDFSWELCTSRIEFYHDSGSMIKYHKNLTAKGYRALIYSGDHDMCVPFTGSEAWTRSLGYKIVDEWRPWTSNGQVAGYTQGYENNLTFLTVKGSGHTVPEYKPREAFDLFSRFLAGKPQ
ncbi:hypothetical protein ACFX13_003812 [Malus domestica]